MRSLLVIISVLCCIGIMAPTVKAQNDTAWKHNYHATETKVNDLVHTKLDVRFDYAKSWMYGKAWLTLHPHFYATDSLRLDAKGMAISEVSISSNGKTIPLHFVYDNMNLRITLNKIYKAGENYTVYINYISKPDEYKAEHSSLMAGEKGLYFINPRDEVKGKPKQIWTQGETEANSYWFPTIDKPNQKTTDEINITVQDKYLTLSNGLLTAQKKNADGTRTDTWKMDVPHAPYLLFMGVGEYSVIKDSYKGKEVSYYVEKEYAPYARKIFGNTPEMIAFFSKITGVDYPWPKYAQITGRDYIFGAMENTSATLHEESSQQDARELVDANSWESVIAHELFHQWFGDYVTMESWSNVTLNESFADYSETLWSEYKYGKEAGQEQIYSDLRNYLGNPGNAEEDLVRFHYKNVLEVFDAVGYQKGGCILNMLRNYVGDSAFFRSLNLYLTTNKFSSAEAQNLRLAFETVTGKDLNWFFNQWYYDHGHPKLDINYKYDPNTKMETVFMKQTQQGRIFKLPFAIDVYEGSKKQRYNVWMDHATDTFSFAVSGNPDLVNVDGDKMLVCEKTDHKTAANFTYQYTHAGSYVDRREAIAYFLNHKEEAGRLEFLKNALQDKNTTLRKFILQRADMKNAAEKNYMEPLLVSIAQNDARSLVRADAISALGQYKKTEYKPLFMKAINDSSYSVAGAALGALSEIDSTTAIGIAKSLATKPAKGALQTSILGIMSSSSDENDYGYVYNAFEQAGINVRFNMLEPLAEILSKTKNTGNVRKEVDLLVKFRDDLPAFLGQFGVPAVNGVLSGVAAAQQAMGNTELGAYILSKVPAASK